MERGAYEPRGTANMASWNAWLSFVTKAIHNAATPVVWGIVLCSNKFMRNAQAERTVDDVPEDATIDGPRPLGHDGAEEDHTGGEGRTDDGDRNVRPIKGNCDIH